MSQKESKWAGGKLTSCDDVKVAFEGVGVDRGNCQEFTNSTWLANGESIGQHLGVEIVRGKEVGVDANGGIRRNVAAGILGCQDGNLFHRPVVAAKEEIADKVRVLAEAGQDGGVAEVWVCVDEAVCEGRAEGVADVDELVKLCADAMDGAIAEEHGNLFKSGSLERLLDLVDGVALGRGSDAKTVPGEG